MTKRRNIDTHGSENFKSHVHYRVHNIHTSLIILLNCQSSALKMTT
jgi:hypothetical protein